MAKLTPNARNIESYEHADKQRLNNPPVGLVTPDTDKDVGTKTYAYDPHLDPQLTWAGKAEHTSFAVPTVSLHVHERIDPRAIIDAVRQQPEATIPIQPSLFDAPIENLPIRQAIEFYKHKHNWSNRLIAGDSLLVMNSLIEKEGMAGQVQMVYIDPPYGIKYGSNFQPFVSNRTVTDGKDDDLSSEPESIKAFRDTWELGIHSYLSYLRDRLTLARELLASTGSIFVQISDENIHRVRCIMDEIFGPENFVSLINFKTMMPLESGRIESVFDYLCWYAKDKDSVKYRNLYMPKNLGNDSEFRFADTDNGGFRRLDSNEIRNIEESIAKLNVFKRSDLASSGYTASCTFPLAYSGKVFTTTSGKSWRTNKDGIQRLIDADRLFVLGSKIYFKMYLKDFGYTSLTNSWQDTIEFGKRVYAVQTTSTVIQRCLLMTTDPGDLVFDPTCGSGTTAYVAEQWGRRWITCDTSRVAITLAKQRLMTSTFDYYKLAHPSEGVGSGFLYDTVPHVTLKSIANNPEIREGMSRTQIDAAIQKYAPQETLYDKPIKDPDRTRVTGPFTVEAVPAPAVISVDEITDDDSTVQPADTSVARSGATLRQNEWMDELLKTGIRGKSGQHIRFSRIEPLPGTRYLHAEGETRPSDEGANAFKEAGTAYTAQRVVISFGQEHAPLEQRQVELAIDEAYTLMPHPKLIVFAAFQFDPEAAKDIDELRWPGVTLLKVQMNADLLTEDLKKKRASNESFWLIGQPDVVLEKITKGDDKGKYRVSVHGFDYYNTKTGNIESGSAQQIAMWMLDPDYDGRSLYPRQVFFPMAGPKDGWTRLARNLNAEIDEELIEAYRGTQSLPFTAGRYRRAAIKIIDDRGIESLKIVELG